MSRKSKSKAGRVVRRTLSDGTVKEYRYAAYKPQPSRVASDSIEALIRAYKRSPHWMGLSEKTRQYRTIYFRELLEIGHIRVKDVARRDMLMIRDAIAVSRGSGAANAFMKAASVLFGWAVDNDWLKFSPVHKIKNLSGGHLPAWSSDQASIALGAVSEPLRRVIVLGLYTGQRRADLCKARWTDYDGSTLRVVQQKTGVEVVLRVHPDLKRELDSWDRISETILTTAFKRPWLPASLSKQMGPALQAAGLPPGLNVHGMRKLFAAGMADNGATVHEIGANTGHRTLQLIELYTRSVDQRKLSDGAVGKIQTHTNADKNQENQ